MKSLQTWTDKVLITNQVQDVNGIPQPIYDVIFNVDGSKLIAAAGSEILIYNSSDGSLFKSLKAHKENVICLCPLLDDGFASGAGDKQVIIWSSTYQGTLKYSHGDMIQSISQNPITGVVLTCTASDFGLWTPNVKAVPKTKVLHINKVPSKIVSSAWTPDGQQFALGLYNGHVSIRSSSGEEQVRIERGDSPIWALNWCPSRELEANVLAVADWSQKLSFFEASGRQLGKDKNLGYDPCAISHFGSGEYVIMGGSNKQVQLWTADGTQMGSICQKEGWIWSCKAKPNQPYVAVGSADGTITMYQIAFDIVHGLYNDRYAFRQNMTDVVIQHMATQQQSRIKCRDRVRKIAVYKDTLAVQLPERVLIYELFYDEQGNMHYRIKEKIPQKLECSILAVTSRNYLFSSENKLEMYGFSGEKEHEWSFDAPIRYIKVIGGPKGKESLLVALKDGQILKIFVNNAFPITLLQHKFPIMCVDINMTRSKLAVVDDQNTCSVYDIAKKELLFQEPDANSVAWNSEVEDQICFSGNGMLNVKVGNFAPHQQKLNGFVVGFKASRVYCLNVYNMTTIEIPQNIPLEGYLEKGDFESAYNIACLGVPDSDWQRLAKTAMENLSLDVAKKSFIRIRDFKFLEAIRIIGKMKNDGRKETDLFLAEVAAYSENYFEVLVV